MLAVISAIISWKDIQQGFYGALLTIDSVFYSAIQYLYDVFIMLTKIKLMDGTEAAQIIQRVYVLIGVVMLFLLSYSLLKSIVNPDNKSIESSGKVIFNIIKSIVLVAFVPTLFDFAFDVQYAVLNQDTIGKLISGSATDSTSGNSAIKEGGINMAMDILQAFIVPTGTNDEGVDITDELYNNGNCPGDLNSCEGYRNLEYTSDKLFKNKENANTGTANTYTFGEFWKYVKTNKNLFIISDIAPELAGDYPRLKHMFLLSTIAAGCVLVLLARYGLSLGLRLVKLAFYELIAPLPILASILPQKKDMLNKWVSATVKTYLEVFIRIAILYLSVYLIGLAGGKITTAVYQTGASATVAFLARAIVILGMVTFLKKAPELISEATGINTDGMSLGIREQLKQGGFYTAAGIAGGAATGLVRRGTNAIKKGRKIDKDLKGKGGKGRFRNGVRTAGSVLFGGLGDAIRGGRQGYNKDAGSFADARDAAHKGGQYVADRISRSNDRSERHAAGVHGFKKNVASLRTIVAAIRKGKNDQPMPLLRYDEATQQIIADPNKTVTGSAAKLENVQKALAKVNMGGSALNGMITGVGQWAGLIGNADAAKKESEISNKLIGSVNEIKDICADIVSKNKSSLKLNEDIIANLDNSSLQMLSRSGIDVKGMSLAAVESLTKQYEGAFNEKAIRDSFKFDEDAFKKSYIESHQNASEAEIAQATSSAKQANEERANKAVNEAITERANIVAALQHVTTQATKTITDDMPERISQSSDKYGEIDLSGLTGEKEKIHNLVKSVAGVMEDNPNSVTIASVRSGVKDSDNNDISKGFTGTLDSNIAGLGSALKNIKKSAEAMKSAYQNEIDAANRLEAIQKNKSSDK